MKIINLPLPLLQKEGTNTDMFQNSTKKSFLLFYLLVFLITSFLVLSAKTSFAADDTSGKACPCGPVESEGNRNIRLQIAIPGITDTCTYKVKTMENGVEGDIDKPCHYVASNLPYFIKKAYSFSIGLIAIMAVIIIMIGGVKWILAAGNPGSITDAKNTITAAVSGLVLALLSYAILYTINPNLTNLQLTTPSSIQTIQQSSNWCTATNLIRPKLAANVQGVPEGFKQWSGECGVEYEQKDTIKDANGNLKTCWGNGGCEDKKFCYQYAENISPFCYDAEEMCVNYGKKSCNEVDMTLQSYSKKYGCAFEQKALVGIDWVMSDKCAYGSVTICNKPGQKRIDCFDNKAKDKCWESDGSKRVYKAYNAVIRQCAGTNERAVWGASYACCLNSNGTVEASAVLGESDVKTINWCSSTTACSNYMNSDSCSRDDCGIGPCSWTSNGCVKKN